jgi:hypothetical protein
VCFGPDLQRAGDRITVAVDNGGLPMPIEESIEIQLDDEGSGCSLWPVPQSWTIANFNHPGCSQVTRPIA